LPTLPNVRVFLWKLINNGMPTNAIDVIVILLMTVPVRCVGIGKKTAFM
jgi:hypothetical protein